MAIQRHWHLPLDPKCEVVADYADTLGDDVTTLSRAGGELWSAFERLHRGECERCTLYGAAEHISLPKPLGFTVVA